MRHGYKVIARSRVHEARDLKQAAEYVARFYPEPSRARARVTLTADRPLTDVETNRLADLAAAMITKEQS